MLKKETPKGNAVKDSRRRRSLKSPSFNGKPEATACAREHRRLRLPVKRREKFLNGVARWGDPINQEKGGAESLLLGVSTQTGWDRLPLFDGKSSFQPIERVGFLARRSILGQ